ncbi:carbon storage regulator CsrA [Legionella bozemanae]|uniref:Translational regulator CsrA n=1 Tax=Legionella bozemanae TaxID=447 RepID=A0A0W0RQ36_LEGBO|nr:carbon storage regulator CsrA [Legionella bozemanae]KTC73169.1 carbon storage regulator RsmA [Legionella bozemanae]STP14114.1 Carbon storage regulator homolog [Legionella bozemanae]
MLSLTRRVGESIVIGEDIFITVLACKGNQVRVAFNAPNSVPIHRYEIYQKIQYEKREGFVDPTKKFCPSMQQSILNHH